MNDQFRLPPGFDLIPDAPEPAFDPVAGAVAPMLGGKKPTPAPAAGTPPPPPGFELLPPGFELEPPMAGLNPPLPPARPADLDTGMNVPEPPATIAAQQAQVGKGKGAGARSAVMFPQGSQEPDLPEDWSRIVTPRGVFHYDPSKIKASQIRELSAKGRENEILGLGPVSKPDADKRIQQGEPPVTVVERQPDGTEVKAAVGTPSTAAKQAKALEKGKLPGSTIGVERPADTAMRRLAQNPPIPPRRPADLGAQPASEALSLDPTQPVPALGFDVDPSAYENWKDKRPTNNSGTTFGMLTPREGEAEQQANVAAAEAAVASAQQQWDAAKQRADLLKGQPEPRRGSQAAMQKQAIENELAQAASAHGAAVKALSAAKGAAAPTMTQTASRAAGFAQTVLEAPTKLGELAGILIDPVAGTDIKGKARAEQDRLKKAFPDDPTRQDEFGQELTEGAGSLVAFLMGGALGRAAGFSQKATSMALGAGMNAADAYTEAEKAKASAWQKAASFIAGGLVGATEGFGAGRLLDHLAGIDKATSGGVRRYFGLILQQKGEEGLQEAVQSLGDDLRRLGILGIDPGDMTENAAKGALLGAILGGSSAAILGAPVALGGDPIRRAAKELVPDFPLWSGDEFGRPLQQGQPTEPAGQRPTPPQQGPQQPEQNAIPPQESPAPDGANAGGGNAPLIEEPAPEGTQPIPAGTDDDARVLRAAGYSDEDIADMSPVERQAALDEARAEGVEPAPSSTLSEPTPSLNDTPAEGPAPGASNVDDVFGVPLDETLPPGQRPFIAEPSDGFSTGRRGEVIRVDSDGTWTVSWESGLITEVSPAYRAMYQTNAPKLPPPAGTRNAPVSVTTESDMDAVRNVVNTTPTEGQKAAGNYQKAHVRFEGLDLSIENPKGSTRSGKDTDGEAWESTLPGDYGYIKGTVGADGDAVDILVGPKGAVGAAYVVEQIDPKTGKFDEIKVITGVETRGEALRLYEEMFSDGTGPQRWGEIVPMSAAELKEWLIDKNGGRAPVPKRYRNRPQQQAQPAAEGWRLIGKNADGNPVYEDERGVRSFVEDGVRVTEAVGIRPDGGILVKSPDERGSNYKTVEETDGGKGVQSDPEQNAPTTINEAEEAITARLTAGGLSAADIDPEALADAALLVVQDGVPVEDAYAQASMAIIERDAKVKQKEAELAAAAERKKAGKAKQPAAGETGEGDQGRPESGADGERPDTPGEVPPAGEGAESGTGDAEARPDGGAPAPGDIVAPVTGEAAKKKNPRTLFNQKAFRKAVVDWRTANSGKSFDYPHPESEVAAAMLDGYEDAKAGRDPDSNHPHNQPFTSDGDGAIDPVNGYRIGYVFGRDGVIEQERASGNAAWLASFDETPAEPTKTTAEEAVDAAFDELLAPETAQEPERPKSEQQSIRDGEVPVMDDRERQRRENAAMMDTREKVQAIADEWGMSEGKSDEFAFFLSKDNDDGSKSWIKVRAIQKGIVVSYYAGYRDGAGAPTGVGRTFDVTPSEAKAREYLREASKITKVPAAAPKTAPDFNPAEAHESVAALQKRLPPGFNASYVSTQTGDDYIRLIDSLTGWEYGRAPAAGFGPEQAADLLKSARDEAKRRDEMPAPATKPTRAPRAPKAPKSASEAATSAVKNVAMSLDQAAEGLMTLFGAKDKGRLGSGPTFDPETYAKALPFFKAGVQHFRNAASDIKALAAALVRHLKSAGMADAAIRAMRPYLVRFVSDVESGKITLEGDADGPATGPVDQGGKRPNSTRVPKRRGGRGNAGGELEGAPSEDGGEPGGADAPAGARPDGSDAERPAGERGGGDAADGREGAGGEGLASDGAGERGRRPASTRPNYHIADPERLVGGTPKVRFARNKAAIEAYRAITEEGRDPTQDELDAMAAYIGWGSFGQELFQGTWDRPKVRDDWRNEDAWLRSHLGKEEWESAQRTIINAHYTDPPTVGAMWDMLRQMGFKGGRVLEPSMGVGNFFGLMPRDLMDKSDLTGIELDALTGGMAKILYPQANVQIKGYEQSKTPDNFYDVVIGNWPFANVPVPDRRYSNLSPSLHDYFFVKALDQVRPGGIVIGITSAGTMDKQATTIRTHLAKNAELVAAFRLPSGAFEKYAGTAVVTDIVILRKREAPIHSVIQLGEAESRWVNTEEIDTPAGEKIRVNSYFAHDRSKVLGTLNFGSGTTYGRAAMIVDRPADLMERLQALPASLPADAFAPIKRGKETRFITNNTKDRDGAIVRVEKGGKDKPGFYIVQGERLVAMEDLVKYRLKDPAATAKRESQFAALINIRRAYGALIDAERAGLPDTEDKRKALKKLYDGFRSKHGTIGNSDGLKFFIKAGDPFAPSLEALERPDGTPSRVLTEPTVRSIKKLENPTVRDAFVLTRNEGLVVDLDKVAELAKKPVAEVERELLDSKAIYRTPGGGYEVADVYLSGNVRRKLREALAAQEEGETGLDDTIAALREVLPKDVPYFQIEAQLGATWVPNDDYRAFIAEMLGVQPSDDIEVKFSAGSWKVRFANRSYNQRPEAQATWGHDRYNFDKLLTAAMNNQSIKIYYQTKDGPVFDEAASKEANEKATRVREEFKAWAWRDPERRVRFEKDYNEVMNAMAKPRFDGSFLEFPGMALRRGDDPFSMRKHQIDATWRGIVNGRGLYAHEVGTGKTYTMGAIAVESRRYGVARKPMIFAHNANSASVAREIQEMYPGAKVLYVDNLSPDKINTTLRRIANDEWDAIVIPHSVADRLALKEETLMAIAAEQIAALEEEAVAAAAEDANNRSTLTIEDIQNMEEGDRAFKALRSPTAKNLVKQRLRIIAKIRELGQRASREGAIAFEDLGVDMIIIDEAHEFKKPPIATKMQMKGLNTATSDRSIALKFLTDYVKSLRGGKGVHVFTGTPITNTLTEIYNMQRFVMEDQMKKDGISEWDPWFNTFASVSTDVELTATGEYEPVTRLASFVNVAELRRMIGQYMDIVFADDMPEFKPRPTSTGKTIADKTLTESERAELMDGRMEKPVGRPYKRVINDVGPMGDQQQEVLNELADRANQFKRASRKERRDWMLAGDNRVPIRVETDAANASLDVRLYDMDGEDHPESKENRTVRNVLKHYNEHEKATQVIFLERGFSDASTKTEKVGSGDNVQKITVKVDRFNLVKSMVDKLVAGGIPREQIAIVDGKVSKEKRKEIADKMNRAEIRVAIGNSQTLGVGVNMQENLRAMHHMDAPWMPGLLEQRNGRGHRQGNKWNTVLEYRYITDKLDGRRWQVLAVKDRFIKAFLKADESIRVIEGEAVEEVEGDDLAKTLSDAAGDPRLLMVNKIKGDIARLEQRERLHSFGIYDARERAKRTEAEIDYIEQSIASYEADHAGWEAVRGPEGHNLRVEIKGKVYEGSTPEERKAAQQALDDYLTKSGDFERGEVAHKYVATVNGVQVLYWWPGHNDKPSFEGITETSRMRYSLGALSLASVDSVMRGLPKRIEDGRASIEDKRQSITRMEDAAKQPFQQAELLEKKRKQLVDLENDIQANPSPPPAWLRSGAPIDTLIYVDGKERVVTGHKWADDGYFVLTDEGPVPYLDAKDALGVPLYEAKAFAAPTVNEDVAASIIDLPQGFMAVQAEKRDTPPQGMTWLVRDRNQGWDDGPIIAFGRSEADAILQAKKVLYARRKAEREAAAQQPPTGDTPARAMAARPRLTPQNSGPSYSISESGDLEPVTREIRQAVDEILDRIVPQRDRRYAQFADLGVGYSGLQAHGVSRSEIDSGEAVVAGMTTGSAYRTVIQIARALPNANEMFPLVARHESIHALKRMGLFTAAEWSELARAAKLYDWAKFAGDKGSIEEGIADAFAHWGMKAANPDTALRITPQIERIFQKVKDFYERLIEAMRGSARERWEDIFRRIESGEIGQRPINPDFSSATLFWTEPKPSGPRPRLTPQAEAAGLSEREITNAVADIVRRVAGAGVNTSVSDTVTVNGRDSAGGWFQAQRLVAVAMTPDYRNTAYHEAFHALQSFGAFTPQEIAVLEREAPRHRAMVLAQYGRVDFDLPVGETSAYAFGYYATAREQGASHTNLHIAVRRAFDKALEILRRIRNWLTGLGFQTAEDIFKSAYEGELAAYRNQSRSWDQPAQAARLWSETPGARAMATTPQRVQNDRGPATGFIENVADRFVRIRELQNQFRRDANIPNVPDVHRALGSMDTRIAARIEDVVSDELNPLLDLIEAAGGEERVHRYLYVRHAEERNEYVAQFNPALPDGGSGIDTATARAELAAFQAAPDFAALDAAAQAIDDMIDRDLDVRLAAGLYSQDQVDALRAMFEHYVPLRGFESDEFEKGTPLAGVGISVARRESPIVKGRKSLADSIIAHTVLMRADGITRAEKNRVDMMLFRLAQMMQAHYGPRSPMKARVKPPLIPSGGSGAPVVNVPHPAYDKEPNVVTGKVGGKMRYVEFEGEAALVEQLKNQMLTNDDVGTMWAGALTRALGRMWTVYNPFFAPVNTVRDFLDASTAATALIGEGGLKGYVSNIPAGVKEATLAVFGRESPAFHRFRQAGGRMSWAKIRNLEDIEREISDRLNGVTFRMDGFVPKTNLHRKALRPVAVVLEGWNDIFENAHRFALYKAAIDKGLPEAQAVKAALEGTLNFNRRGSGGLVRAARIAYPFMNPSIQAPLRAARLVQEAGGLGTAQGKKQAAKLLVRGLTKTYLAFTIAGFAIGMLNYALGGDDDDETPFWDKAQWNPQSRKNIMIYTGGKDEKGRPNAIMIPAFPEIMLPFHIGNALAASIWGKQSAADVAKQVGLAFAQLSPTEGRGAVPAVIAPLYEIYANKNHFGGPVHPSETPYTRGVPKPERKFSSTDPKWQEVARAFGAIGLNLHPEDYRHMARSYIGGWYQIAEAIAGGTGLTDPDDKVNIVARRFYLPGDKGVAPYERDKFRESEGKANAQRAKLRARFDDPTATTDREQRENRREKAEDIEAAGGMVGRNGGINTPQTIIFDTGRQIMSAQAKRRDAEIAAAKDEATRAAIRKTWTDRIAETRKTIQRLSNDLAAGRITGEAARESVREMRLESRSPD